MHEDFSRTQKVAPPTDRSFGLVMAAAFAVIGGLSWWRSGQHAGWAAAASALFLLFAWLAPAVLRPLARLWMRFGLLLHRAVTPIILAGMYFLVLTPVARLARLAGHEWLPLDKDPAAPTYWHTRTGQPSSMSNQY